MKLTDAQWEILSPLMPQHERQGRPFRDRRQVVNGMFWILRTGAPWRDLPGGFRPWHTVYDRFSRWRADGTLECILEALQVRLGERGEIEKLAVNYLAMLKLAMLGRYLLRI